MEVLIAYGSKRGGTAGLAEMIGQELIRSPYLLSWSVILYSSAS